MKTSVSRVNSIKFIIGLVVGVGLYLITNGVAFMIPLMLIIIIYNVFLSKHFNHFKI